MKGYRIPVHVVVLREGPPHPGRERSGCGVASIYFAHGGGFPCVQAGLLRPGEGVDGLK